jgi:hypothetical protein
METPEAFPYMGKDPFETSINIVHVLIDIYGHKDDDDFWAVMDHHGDKLIRQVLEQKDKVRYVVPNFKKPYKLPHHKYVINILKDIAYILKVQFRFSELEGHFIITRGKISEHYEEKYNVISPCWSMYSVLNMKIVNDSILLVNFNDDKYTDRFEVTNFYTKWKQSQYRSLYSMSIAKCITVEDKNEYELSTFYFMPHLLMTDSMDGKCTVPFYDLLTFNEKEFFKGLGRYLLHVLIIRMLEVIPEVTIDTVLRASIENGKSDDGDLDKLEKYYKLLGFELDNEVASTYTTDQLSKTRPMITTFQSYINAYGKADD